jgi:hypothetical protein
MEGMFLEEKVISVYEGLNEKERCVFELYLLDEEHNGYTQDEIGTLCWPDKPVSNAMVSTVVRKIRKKFENALFELEDE